MQEDKVKIVLTRPALERLIGGDSEAEIVLRSATVERIVQKYFEPLIMKKNYQTLLNDLTKKVSEQILFKDTNWYSSSYVSSDAKKKVEDYTREVANQFIKQTVQSFLSEAKIKEMVEHTAIVMLREQVRAELQEKVRRSLV